MSLYGVQKFLFHLNRDQRMQQRFRAEPDPVLDEYPLDSQEREAVRSGDVGLIYVLGANGQLLMHYAAYLGMPWPAYIQAMRDGVARHGAVRAGVYAMTTAMDERVAGV
jgi:hypothetical protein